MLRIGATQQRAGLCLENEGTLQITEDAGALGFKPDAREPLTPIFAAVLSMVAGLRRMMSWEVSGDSYTADDSDTPESTESVLLESIR